MIILQWVDQGTEGDAAVDYIVAILTDQNLSLVKDHIAYTSQDSFHGEAFEQAAYTFVVDPGQLSSARQTEFQDLTLFRVCILP